MRSHKFLKILCYAKPQLIDRIQGLQGLDGNRDNGNTKSIRVSVRLKEPLIRNTNFIAYLFLTLRVLIELFSRLCQ